MRILYINPLRERHGSTYRARNLSKLLSLHHQMVYVEPKENERGLQGRTRDSDGIGGFLRSAVRFLAVSLLKPYDVIFLQKPIVLTLPALVIAKLKRKGVAIDFDDLDSGWQTSEWKRRLALLGERVMPRYANVVTTHNTYLKAHLARFIRARIALIPQGVDTHLFDPGRFEPVAGKKQLGIDGKTVFCFLGSFTKGSAADLDVILKAFSQVSMADDKAFLLIIGGGGPLEEHYLGMIRNLGLKNILVTGRKAQQEIPKYLSCADYGLVFMRDNPSNRFRMSLKALEYLSMDLQVIGHLVGGTKDTLGDHCITCAPSVDSLSKTMLHVLKNGPAKTPARETIVAHFDWKKFVPLLDNVIDRCAEGRG